MAVCDVGGLGGEWVVVAGVSGRGAEEGRCFHSQGTEVSDRGVVVLVRFEVVTGMVLLEECFHAGSCRAGRAEVTSELGTTGTDGLCVPTYR